jgi:hypothetical protein
MKHLCIFYLFGLLAYSNILLAQQGIYGSLVTAQATPLKLVEVRLLNSDTIAQQAVLSNNDGLYGFDIQNPGIYALQVCGADSQKYILYDIEVPKDSSILVHITCTPSAKKDLKFIGTNKQIGAKKIEKLPTLNPNDIVTRSSGYVNSKSGQVPRSTTSPRGELVRYIVDGMVLPPNSPLIFTPGSLQSVDLIQN